MIKIEKYNHSWAVNNDKLLKKIEDEYWHE